MAGCYQSRAEKELTLIQIQDRNGLTETMSTKERLARYETTDFLSPQPYQKVLRVYKQDQKSESKITSYYSNGMICQYLEAKEMRANGAYREWYPNGQQKIEAVVIGGTADLAENVQQDWVFDGMSRVWDDQGNPIATLCYEKGILQGKNIYYYPNGNIQTELHFSKNKLDQDAVEYWPNGSLKTRTNYQNGLREGKKESFFENGSLASKEDFSEDFLREGLYYNSDGEELSRVEKGSGFQASFQGKELTLTKYRMGHPEGLIQKFSKNGELQARFVLQKGIKQGDELLYYLQEELNQPTKEPALKLLIPWVSGKIQGKVKTWYPNGQLQSEREYIRNEKAGPSLAWYPSGDLMLYEEYEENRLVTGQYYSMGKKEPLSSVSHGEGIVILFDETGALLQKVKYEKGKPVDPEN